MSITDELRTEARGFGKYIYKSEQAHRLLAIADRIDAEHERAVRYERCAFWHDASDDELAKYGLLRAPIDADGEVIRVGDVMEWPTTGETFEVVGIGDGTLFYIEDGSELADWTGASTKRHYHAPTVEDVLGEFFEEVGDGLHTLKAVDTQVIIAKYAAKLRLAGDAE